MFSGMLPSLRLHKGVGIFATTVLKYSKFNWAVFNKARRFKKMIEKIAKQKKENIGKSSYLMLLEKRTLPSAYENEGSTRRVTVLNKVYMEHLAMMVNSGECGRKLNDLGIEITRINFAKGLNFLNIYWLTRNTDIPEDVVNETLKGVLAELQLSMGTLRFTSKVPFLKFVRDLRLEKESHLEKIFQTADFGKDFQPTYGKKVITPYFVSQPGQFPKMRQNTLGLDHAKITQRIKADVLKKKAIKIDGFENDCREVSHEMPQKLIKFNRKDFLNFYKRKKFLVSKIWKMTERRREDNYDEDESLDTFWDPLPEFEEPDYEDINEYELKYDKTKD